MVNLGNLGDPTFPAVISSTNEETHHSYQLLSEEIIIRILEKPHQSWPREGEDNHCSKQLYSLTGIHSNDKMMVPTRMGDLFFLVSHQS